MSVPFYSRHPSMQQIIYGGIPFAGVFVSKERLEKIPAFEVREDDVCLAAYPRTGSRWTAEMLSWIIRDGDEEGMNTSTNAERCPILEMAFPGQPNVVDNPSAFNFTDRPRLYSTHLPFHMAPEQLAQKGKVVCVLRNPKDCAVSFYHFYRMNKALGPYDGTWEDFLEGFSRGELEYGSYFDFVTGWWARRHQANILFLRYEQMKKSTGAHVKEIAEFLGKSLSQSTIDLIVERTSFQSMKSNPNTNPSKYGARLFRQDIGVEAVRKGEVSDWKRHFTVSQNQAFDELIAEKLKNTDLVFDYGPLIHSSTL